MLTRYQPFIDGVSTPVDTPVFQPLNPATGLGYAEVSSGTAVEVDLAVRSAERAFHAWKLTKPVDRGRILYKVAEAIRGNIDELAALETQDIGQPISLSIVDAEAAARYFEFFAGAVDKVHGETLPLGPDYHSYTERVPFGVVGHILPWNAPLQQVARGVAPSLAVGQYRRREARVRDSVVHSRVGQDRFRRRFAGRSVQCGSRLRAGSWDGHRGPSAGTQSGLHRLRRDWH
jgi:aldehyde dehydrogenase (NAD+)